MESVTSVQTLHEAAHEEWLASRTAVRNRRAELLELVRDRLDAGDDPDRDVLPALHRELAAERTIDASIGFIVTGQETMMLGFIAGVPANLITGCLKLDFGQAICGTVAQTRQAMHVSDIAESEDPITVFARSSGITACVCVPLMVGMRLFGTLAFASRSRRRFDHDEIQFFLAIGAYVASARQRQERELAARSRLRTGTR